MKDFGQHRKADCSDLNRGERRRGSSSDFQSLANRMAPARVTGSGDVTKFEADEAIAALARSFACIVELLESLESAPDSCPVSAQFVAELESQKSSIEKQLTRWNEISLLLSAAVQTTIPF